ncbi:hypothetical protein CRG98_048746, partial [Punica granatum]
MVISMMKLMASGIGDGGERQVMEVEGVMGVKRGQMMKMVIAMESKRRCKGVAATADRAWEGPGQIAQQPRGSG